MIAERMSTKKGGGRILSEGDRGFGRWIGSVTGAGLPEAYLAAKYRLG